MSQTEQDQSVQSEISASDSTINFNEQVYSIVDTLSGQQKVAALLVAMGKPAAAKLLKHFSPDDLRRLSRQANSLPNISISDFDILVREFEDSFAEGVSYSHAGARFTSLVQDTLTEEEAEQILDPKLNPEIPAESIWEAIFKLPLEDLQALLAFEHPQVVAYILSHLPSDLSAKVIVAQTMAVRADIIRRTLHQRTVKPIVDDLLEESLRPNLSEQSGGIEQANHSQIAAMLNQLDKSDIDEMLANLDTLSPKDLEKIKAKLFSFDDIPRLTERARLLLFDYISADVIITALRGADASIRELILGSLSQRSRRMVESELSVPNDLISNKEVSSARRSIAQSAMSLAEEGKISLSGDD